MKEEVKVYKYGGKMWLKVIREIKEPDYSAKLFEENIKNNAWLLDHYIYFRPWDYCFNAELFGDSLKATGRNLIKYGNGINSIKHGRRAIYAGHLMGQVYGYNTDDNTYRNRTTWINKVTKLTFENHQLKTIHPFISDERYEKYWAINNRKCEEGLNSDAETLWHLLKTYLTRFWD